MPLKTDRKMGPRELALRQMREARMAGKRPIAPVDDPPGFQQTRGAFQIAIDERDAEIARLKRALAEANAKLEEHQLRAVPGTKLGTGTGTSTKVPKVPSATGGEPWVAEGISRRTWFRRKASRENG